MVLPFNFAIYNNASTMRVPPRRWVSTENGPFIPIRCRSSTASSRLQPKKLPGRGKSSTYTNAVMLIPASEPWSIRTKWWMLPACPPNARSWPSPEKQVYCKVQSRSAEPFMSSLPNTELRQELKRAVAELCSNFPDTYWRELDSHRAYPEAFVQALTK